MGHHDTEATPNQSRSDDKSSQRGSGHLTGVADQGGSGQTGKPPMDRSDMTQAHPSDTQQPAGSEGQTRPLGREDIRPEAQGQNLKR